MKKSPFDYAKVAEIFGEEIPEKAEKKFQTKLSTSASTTTPTSSTKTTTTPPFDLLHQLARAIVIP